ncbi:hypothetical protein FKR81_30900 [Lentzea tibetensis]|uniref:Uncharacterized protein n=1 Tax=Lentzea tibetensis TaxID=2591470 RepID=A0A563EKZ0_9PSEU|nr:hypothetical protein [Lentzea tibetensis]TWP47754.1 hypothetical protein FKR81_30900 [Lentzea tibetensis]
MARWLWIASALLGLVQVMVDLSDRDTLIAEIRKRDPGMSQDEIDAAVQAGLLFTLLIAGLIVLVYVKIANRMAWGRNWARIVLTVLGAGSVGFGLLQLLAHASGVAAVFGVALDPVDASLTVAGIGLDGTAIVLMFLPAAAAHFRQPVAVDRVPDQS